jgi:Zn-dependent protease
MSEEKKSKGILALFFKLGGKFFSLLAKLVKGLKFLKFGLAAATFGSYAYMYSWKFAVLLMIAIGFHESGHVYAMKRLGIKTRGFYFLPFLGGVAIGEGQYKSYRDNVYVSIMGPLWGAAMSWGCVGLYWLTGNPLWAAAGAWMATLNLFNLLPINPLDGGQLVRSIAFSINKWTGVGFLALSLLGAGIIFYKLRIGLFVLMLIIGAIELISEVNARVKMYKYDAGEIDRWDLPKSVFDKDGEIRKYPESMSKKQLAIAALVYAFTIAVLVAIHMLVDHVPGAGLAANFLA